MLGLWRGWRRRRWQQKPFPSHWRAILNEVPFYVELAPDERQRFESRVRNFVWEKVWVEAGGMRIDDRVKLFIASAATRIALELPESVYDRLSEVVVYPSHYHHPDRDAVIFGEAHDWGVVVLSWEAVQQGIANPHDGHDTAAHEFAHVLDRGSGRFDGTPNLHARGDYRIWGLVLSHHFAELRRGTRKTRRLLGDYAATNEAEFFAVATETYFEQPEKMQREAPDLFEELQRFYHPSRAQPR